MTFDSAPTPRTSVWIVTVGTTWSRLTWGNWETQHHLPMLRADEKKSIVSWETVFMPSASLLELFIRGTVMYLAVFAIMRIAGRRESGELNMSDLILIVIISEAASVGIGGEATSIFDSIILVATIVVWSIVLDWASYHSRFVEKLVKPRPKPLIRDGILDKRVARKEFLTIEELQSQLRLNGMTDISEVAVARIEPNGEISFIQRNRQ